MRKVKCLVWILFAFFLFVVVSGNSAFSEESYPLGVALSISGPGSLYCGDGLDAVRLAVGEINASGGFLGKQINRTLGNGLAGKGKTGNPMGGFNPQRGQLGFPLGQDHFS